MVTFAESIDSSSNMEDIRVRLDNDTRLWSEFISVEDKIFEIAPEEESQSEEFDETYYHAAALLTAALRHYHSASQANTSTGARGESTCQFNSSSSETKLPRVIIPIFQGDFKEWQSFFDLFNSAIHEKLSLSAAQKLQYLKGVLKGEPLSLIRHLNITDSNYIEAYQILIRRYDKKKFTITSYIDSFVKQPTIIRVNASNVRKLADTTEEIIRGLKAIGTSGDSRDPWLIYIIVNKLDDETRQFWQLESSKTDYPTLQNLIDCLHTRADTLEGIRETITKPTPRITTSVHTTSAINLNCPLCNIEHMLYQCPKFRDMNVDERRLFINQKLRCYNCLSESHTVKFCKSKRSCQICRKRHNSLLHNSNASTSVNIVQPSTLPTANTLHSQPNISSSISSSTSSPINIPAPTPQLTSQSTSICTTSVPITNLHQSETQPQPIAITHKATLTPKEDVKHNNHTVHALLPTAIVHVKDIRGNTQPCRVLLDSGSQASFVTEDCVKRLALHKQKANITIKGVGSSTAGVTTGATILEISPRLQSRPKLFVNALILPKVTAQMPSTNINVECWNHLKGLELADPTFHETNTIDILIGADYFFDILTEGKVSCGQGRPIAQNTIFGWIVAGNSTKTNSSGCSVQLNFCTELDIDQTLRNFWEIEELPPSKHLTEEEKLCENHFAETYRCTEEGRFIVHLPFKQPVQQLGNTRDQAIRRLFAMETKFRKDPNLKTEYTAFMTEYIKLGHMERIHPIIPIVEPRTSFYMPHHAVFKRSSTTTKLRVVFDASAKSSTKISLNDNLMLGPTVQDSLFAILVRFRKHAVVFTSDIGKMYRQIRITPEDANFQRIVWRESPEVPVEDYQLLTVTYGTASAPYLATKTLATIADNNMIKFPRAAKIIKQDFYIDDLMSEADNKQDASLLQSQIINILGSAGFRLRKWTSNCASLLAEIPIDSQEISPIEISEGSRSVKLLGLEWCPKNDVFQFKVEINPETNNTKRTLLSDASKIFDPLGWLSPYIIMVKLLFQSLWLLNLSWDDPLPTNISKRWQELRQELCHISKTSIPRWLFTESKNDEKWQLHGFSDASEFAYSAVIYCRTNKEGTIKTTIVCAKTRVAPIKHVSIPRLELCGALLLTRLMKAVIEALHVENIEVYNWTDSTDVLWWLSSHPRCWKSYVANRTAEILESTLRNNWRYVPTKENPADCASRGILPSKLCDLNQWWKGPTWLHQDPEYWPSQQKLVRVNPHTNEEKPKPIHKMNVAISNNFLENLSNKYSKFSKLVRIIALLLHFRNNIKRSISNESKSKLLSPQDYNHATNVIFKWVQTGFHSEISCIMNKKPLPKNSKVVALNPFLDDQGVLRVGSRIRHANIEYNKRFPIILPANHIITQLIIDETHVKNLHAAQSLMVSTLRQRYWIINCKNLVRQNIHRCVPCTRYKPQRINQLMGDLPPARTNFKYVFNQAGIDYAGPIWLRAMVGRRSKPHKGYIAIFVCMSSKAVHIELVSDLSTNAFLAALKRFMSRRGVPSDIFSDNGTNFVGARNQLQELYKLNKSIKHNNLITNFLLDYQTKWHFSPPSGPNFGGLYESAVKSAKFHLRRVLGNTILNFEEMATLLTQIEAILNSRPLCSLSPDPDGIDMLTPAHFIIGHSLTLPPDPSFTEVKSNTLKRWNLIQQIMQHFWNRFHKEYLTTLHNRSKWQHKNVNIKIDDIIIIRDDNTPPAQWPLGKIIQIHPGLDGLVRVVSIKTKAGILKRPITKIVLLPVS